MTEVQTFTTVVVGLDIAMTVTALVQVAIEART
jgi:hypothetical protein